MAEPRLVAECVAAMRAAVSVPVTVKCRIGIDDQDSETALDDFIGTVADAGCDTVIVHARKAWLAGLSPKENRKSRRWVGNVRLLSVDEPMVVDGMGAVVDRDELERAFRRLSMNHRTVVVLHHYLDLPLDRVADIVGAPLGTVGSRLHYATRQLRTALVDDAQPAAREVVG
jgi:tRNA-dihydrouridine synthase